MYDCLGQDENFLGLESHFSDPETARVVIVPVPYEQTSSYGMGSNDGAAAILEASHQVEFFDGDLGFEPREAVGGIATMSLLDVSDIQDGASMCDRLDDAVSHWLDKGKEVVTITGEHAGVVGAVRAHAKRNDNLTVLQLDAHADLRADYHDDPWNHACAIARVLDFHTDVVQVGIRSEASEERETVNRLGFPVFRGADIQRDDKLGKDWVQSVIDACAENVYITFDCDVLDPSIMPATGTPEPGGMTWEQVNELFARLAQQRNIVGFDLCELAPIPTLHHPQFIAAKLIYRLIGYFFAD